MPGILIACPMTREAEALGRLLKPDHAVRSTGLGIQRSVPSLLKQFQVDRPDLLIFTGSASQLDLSLNMGDIVLPLRWGLEEGICFDSPPGLMSRLQSRDLRIVEKGLTLTKPVLKAEQRDQLHRKTGASVYDTATAAVLRVAQTEGVPCVAPKIVASTVHSGLMTFWNRLDENLEPLAAYLRRLMKVLESLEAD